MFETNDFVPLSDAETTEIVGGDGFWVFVLTYLWNNAGELVAGIKEGYAMGGSPQP